MRSRRDFLTAAAAGAGVLAGCTGRSTGSPTSASNATTVSATSTTSTTGDTSSTPRPLPASAASFDVALVRDATAAHPARVRATLANESDAAFTLSSGYYPPFSVSNAHAVAGDGSLALYPVNEDARQYVTRPGSDESGPPTATQNGCWRVTDAYAVAGIARTLTLAPDESASATYDVYTDGDGACFPDGDYRAEHTATVSPGSHYDASDTTAWLYGVTLHVRNGTITSLDVEEVARVGGA